MTTAIAGFLSTLTLALTALPVLFLLLYETIILALAYRRGSPLSTNISLPSKVEVVVPTYSEPIELVVEKARRNSAVLLQAPCFTRLTILSDDSDDYVRSLREALGSDLPIAVFHRQKRRGGRTGALDDYLKALEAPHFLVLDADAELSADTAWKICRLLPDNGALVIPWEGYFTRETRLAHAVKFITDFGSEILYRLRGRAGFFIFPLGSGTIYDKKLVVELGGWGDDIVQDDIWMGVKLALNGRHTSIAEDLSLRVLVPSTLASFKKQQKRWAYGTSDVLRRSAPKLLTSKELPLGKRLEMIAYISLPLLAIPATLSLLLLPVAGILEPCIGPEKLFKEALLPLLPLLFLAPIYLPLYRKSLKKFSIKQSITNLGRFAAVLATLIPALAWSSLKGLLGIPYSFEVTPKGRKEAQEKRPRDPLYMWMWSTLSLAISLVRMNTATALLSLAFLAASTWTCLRAHTPP
jgi:cellulose synthase/poly-beta-1,6-N-acetylglucosamine synthase-like glycosyltransferase